LLARCIELPRTTLIAHPELALTPAQIAMYRLQVEQRAAGTPLPYLVGEVEFFGLAFQVTPDVLIPRPETELLLECVLAWLSAHPAAVAVDVGTGSGCIAVSLALHAPTIAIYATDISCAALQVAAANAALHAVSAQIRFRRGDLLAPVPEPVDVILSNPPYIAEPDWDTLPASVRREPRIALLSGPDGLDAVRRLLRQAVTRLKPGGLLALEIGETQGEAAASLARAAFPEACVRIVPDLAGKPRVLEVCLPPG